MFASMAARLLNSVGGHIFCYSAISSAGVVLILPGFLVRASFFMRFTGRKEKKKN